MDHQFTIIVFIHSIINTVKRLTTLKREKGGFGNVHGTN